MVVALRAAWRMAQHAGGMNVCWVRGMRTHRTGERARALTAGRALSWRVVRVPQPPAAATGATRSGGERCNGGALELGILYSGALSTSSGASQRERGPAADQEQPPDRGHHSELLVPGEHHRVEAPGEEQHAAHEERRSILASLGRSVSICEPVALAWARVDWNGMAGPGLERTRLLRSCPFWLAATASSAAECTRW